VDDALQSMLDSVEAALSRVQEAGADFADARIGFGETQYIVADNGRLQENVYRVGNGVGFRVLYKGSMGYASTTSMKKEAILEAAERAFRSARALGEGRTRLAPYKAIVARAWSKYQVDPFDVDDSEKVDLVLSANKAALQVPGVVSAVTSFGALRSRRIVVNTEGSRVETEIVMTGLSHTSVARRDGTLETVGDYESTTAGYEFILSLDWEEMVLDVSRLAVLAAGARVPPSGSFTVVLDPRMVGLLLHEALGHASEGDIVASGASAIAGRLGERIAPEHVTIVDDGRVPGGVYVPYDDEGVEKKRTPVVEKGVLTSYLTDRASAAELGLDPTGNGRVMSFSNPILVRQTNYYLEPGDYDVDELIGEVREGFYLTAKGSRGGEVNPGMGTFTFSAGVSWRIENGMLVEPVRGVSLSGNILDVLANIRGLGRDFEIETSVFGGCGKGGQLVKVGTGGPHVLVDKIAIGGR